MEDRISKSGFRLSVCIFCTAVLFFAGSSYAVNLSKNTPLYRHLVKGRNSQQVRLYEKKQIASTEQVEAPLKSSDAISEVQEQDNPADEAAGSASERAVRNRIFRNRPANLMDPSTFTPQMPFSEAVEILRNSTIPRLNISVLWKDLEEHADIYPDTPIGIDGVSGVPLSRHLKSLLDGVSGASPERLGYVVDDGVIIVATLDSLPSRMVTRVYDITDLVGRPSTGFPQMGMMGMGMPGMGMMGMGMGAPGMGMGMQGMGMGFGSPFGSGYGMQSGFGSPFGTGYGIQGGITPGLGTGYGNFRQGYNTTQGVIGSINPPYRPFR